jgi:hypothetical protein
VIKLVDARPGITCAIQGRISHRCPVADEVDKGRVEIVWETTESTLELHSLRAYLASWADRATTHEDLCAQIADHITGAGVSLSRVTYFGVTAGLSVIVTGGPGCGTSPTRQHRRCVTP